MNPLNSDASWPSKKRNLSHRRLDLFSSEFNPCACRCLCFARSRSTFTDGTRPFLEISDWKGEWGGGRRGDAHAPRKCTRLLPLLYRPCAHAPIPLPFLSLFLSRGDRWVSYRFATFSNRSIPISMPRLPLREVFPLRNSSQFFQSIHTDFERRDNNAHVTQPDRDGNSISFRFAFRVGPRLLLLCTFDSKAPREIQRLVFPEERREL